MPAAAQEYADSGWNWDHTYARLPELFFTRVRGKQSAEIRKAEQVRPKPNKPGI